MPAIVPVVVPVMPISSWEEAAVCIIGYIIAGGIILLAIIIFEGIRALWDRYSHNREMRKWEKAKDMGEVYDWRKRL